MAWQSIEDGRSLGHAFSHAHGLTLGSITLVLLNDVDACQAIFDELSAIAERNR